MNKQVCAEPMRETPAATKAEGFTTSRHLRPRLMSGEGANTWQRPPRLATSEPCRATNSRKEMKLNQDTVEKSAVFRRSVVFIAAFNFKHIV